MRARKKPLIAAAIVILLVALAAAAWFVPVFKVGGFKVEGQVNTAVEEIEAATGVAVGDNLLRVNAQSAARGVSALPWVESVSVSKSYPSTLQVEVHERTAAMYAKRSDGSHLIDSTGQAFLIADPPAGTPEVNGQNDDNQEVFAAVASALGALDDATRAQVTAVQAPSQYEITLQIGPDKKVYWGSVDNAADKAVATKVALTRPEASLDVSGAPTIALKR